jgi:hypothetical protein
MCSNLLSLLDWFGLVFTVLTVFRYLACILNSEGGGSVYLQNLGAFLYSELCMFAGYERQDEHLQGQRA